MRQTIFNGKVLILFDLDGTLVDSVPDLACSIDYMLTQMGYARRGEKSVRGYIGNGATRLIERALTGDMDAKPDIDEYQRAQALFFTHYGENVCVHSRLYPATLTMLQNLQQRGLTLAVVTNKPAEFTQPLLHALGIDGFFSMILSGDSLSRKKPDPLPLLHAATELGFEIEQSLMVGDSSNDIVAAKSAAMQCVAVSYGYNHGVAIEDAGPDAVIDCLDQLPAMLV